MRWILIKTKYKQKMQIILQYKKLWGKLEIINIIKANVGKYTRKGRKGVRSCQRTGKDRRLTV